MESTSPRVVFLVPRRADSGRRDDLWRFCRTWWSERFPDWQIIEGTHEDGDFNRSAALNTAAAAAGEWDAAVILDADVVAEAEQVHAAVEQALHTGRMTLAFDRYAALSEEMSDRVLGGYDGSWESGAKLKMRTHVSSIVAVPAALWERVNGFDERFQGWGHDDVSFAAACRVLGGGVDRVPGTVWHLWHSPATANDRRSAHYRSTPSYRASSALAGRYHEAITPAAMSKLIGERGEVDGVALVVVTHGRRECIAETIPSALENLKGLPIVRCIVSDDSGDPDYWAWLRLTFPSFELVTGKPGGFAANTARAWDAALASGQRLVFWLEDDFRFERPVDLDGMAQVLDDNPHVLQMALRRQAWSAPELEAGGVIQQNPEAYTDCNDDAAHHWLEHQLFWTTNPHLVRREVLARYQWPAAKKNSEAVFGRQTLTGELVAGYWGRRTDDPWVEHFGERTGRGY